VRSYNRIFLIQKIFCTIVKPYKHENGSGKALTNNFLQWSTGSKPGNWMNLRRTAHEGRILGQKNFKKRGTIPRYSSSRIQPKKIIRAQLKKLNEAGDVEIQGSQ
jgi:hypothetical protein